MDIPDNLSSSQVTAHRLYSSNLIWVVVGSLLIGIAIGVLGMYLVSQFKSPEKFQYFNSQISPTGYVSPTESLIRKETPISLPSSTKMGWASYTDPTYKYTIQYPNTWKLTSQADREGDPEIKLEAKNQEQGVLQGSKFPSITIGLTSPYSTANTVCANQGCQEVETQTITMNGKTYSFKIIRATGQNETFYYDAFTFPISHKKISRPNYGDTPLPLNVYAFYLTKAHEKEIVDILSTLTY